MPSAYVEQTLGNNVKGGENCAEKLGRPLQAYPKYNHQGCSISTGGLMALSP